MVVVEALAIIAISCVRRVVSFKHTHLVERIGLLTLIIMGEGIMGLGTSVSTILQNSTVVSKSAIGTKATLRALSRETPVDALGLVTTTSSPL